MVFYLLSFGLSKGLEHILIKVQDPFSVYAVLCVSTHMIIHIRYMLYTYI